MPPSRNIKEMDKYKEIFLCVLPGRSSGSHTPPGTAHPILEPSTPRGGEAVNENE